MFLGTCLWYCLGACYLCLVCLIVVGGSRFLSSSFSMQGLVFLLTLHFRDWNMRFWRTRGLMGLLVKCTKGQESKARISTFSPVLFFYISELHVWSKLGNTNYWEHLRGTDSKDILHFLFEKFQFYINLETPNFHRWVRLQGGVCRGGSFRKGTFELRFAKPTVVQQLRASQHPGVCKKLPGQCMTTWSLNSPFTTYLHSPAKPYHCTSSGLEHFDFSEPSRLIFHLTLTSQSLPWVSLHVCLLWKKTDRTGWLQIMLNSEWWAKVAMCSVLLCKWDMVFQLSFRFSQLWLTEN